MASSAALLKPTEAAVLAGVSLREVNRVIDEGILPDDFLDTEEVRYTFGGPVWNLVGNWTSTLGNNLA